MEKRFRDWVSAYTGKKAGGEKGKHIRIL